MIYVQNLCVSIVDFEQVNVNWVIMQRRILGTVKDLLSKSFWEKNN